MLLMEKLSETLPRISIVVNKKKMKNKLEYLLKTCINKELIEIIYKELMLR